GGGEQGPDEGEPGGAGGDPGHEFAQPQPGDLGGDGLELAPDLDGSVRLEVDRVELRGAAVEVDVDDCPGRGPDPGRLLGAEQVGQGQAAQAEGAGRQEVPPGDPIAVPVGFSEDGQHADLPPGFAGLVLRISGASGVGTGGWPHRAAAPPLVARLADANDNPSRPSQRRLAVVCQGDAVCARCGPL